MAEREGVMSVGSVASLPGRRHGEKLVERKCPYSMRYHLLVLFSRPLSLQLYFGEDLPTQEIAYHPAGIHSQGKHVSFQSLPRGPG